VSGLGGNHAPQCEQTSRQKCAIAERRNSLCDREFEESRFRRRLRRARDVFQRGPVTDQHSSRNPDHTQKNLGIWCLFQRRTRSPKNDHDPIVRTTQTGGAVRVFALSSRKRLARGVSSSSRVGERALTWYAHGGRREQMTAAAFATLSFR
jgi:hypothetical protein